MEANKAPRLTLSEKSAGRNPMDQAHIIRSNTFRWALAVAGVFVLRRRRPELVRPYRAWGYPVVPALFLLASLGMIANALWAQPRDTGLTLLIILAGVPLYYLWKLARRSAGPRV